MGERIVRDFSLFDWPWINSLPAKLGWQGKLTSNMMFVGQRGCVTPAHIDEQHNIFAQLCGRKRFVLFPPGDWDKLYPFPNGHPNDRQSQVDYREPDFSRFPRFVDVKPYEAVLGPGDVLFVPQYWWHHVENLDDGCVSVNFWFTNSGVGDFKETKVSAACVQGVGFQPLQPSGWSFHVLVQRLAVLKRRGAGCCSPIGLPCGLWTGWYQADHQRHDRCSPSPQS